MADQYEKLRGIIGSIVKLGTQALGYIQWKNEAGTAAFKDATDVNYVNVRGADPLIDDDLVTKRFYNNNVPLGSDRIIRYQVTQAGPVTQDSTALIPLGSRVLETSVEIVTPFDGAGATVNVGYVGATNTYMASADIDNSQAATYRNMEDVSSDPANDRAVRTSIAAGGGTLGVAIVTVRFCASPLV
jgi:hypothetical protein